MEPLTEKQDNNGHIPSMPAHNVKFTANWKTEQQATYYVQFWAEDADSTLNIDMSNLDSLSGEQKQEKLMKFLKYKYVGRKPQIAQIGSEITEDMLKGFVKDVNGIKFPDIDLEDCADSNKFERYYTYSENFTKICQCRQKGRGDEPTIVNIYLDRREYEMIFVKSYNKTNTFMPAITKKLKNI